eukprot:scaffold7926_cov98-Skeletonema_dohrnii-CCMP3373.AAC.2
MKHAQDKNQHSASWRIQAWKTVSPIISSYFIATMNREPAANNGHRCRIMAATPPPLSRKMMGIISGTALDY